ncbi:ANKRD50 [Symbiodinium sp. CCMP2592]|nr:ANKRD50 [Symbiodinium sp. CCMP2592]
MADATSKKPSSRAAHRRGTLVLLLLFGAFLAAPGGRFESFALPGLSQVGGLPARWFGDSILCVDCAAQLPPSLGESLVRSCRELQAQSRGRKVSNNGGWQSQDLPLDDNLGTLLDVVQGPAKEYLDTMGWRYPDEEPIGDGGLEIAIVADRLWANINRPGDWNSRHTHGRPTDSLFAAAVYYPQVSPRTSAARPARLLIYPRNSDPVPVTPATGLLVLFPVDMPHEVEASPRGADERVSYAFNLEARWLPGPLLQAAFRGDADKVSTLAARDPAARDALLGRSAAQLAAEQGHVAVLEALVSAKAELSALEAEESPLALAAGKGHKDAVVFLQDTSSHHGPALGAALASAAERGHVSVVAQLLLGHWANVEAGATRALAAAARAGHATLVQHLLDAGVPADGPELRQAANEAATRDHAEVVALLADAGVDFTVEDRNGKTPLMNAAAGGHSEVVKLLLRNCGCSADARDRQGATAMHWAAWRGHRGGGSKTNGQEEAERL